jgi:hypothetical protein
VLGHLAFKATLFAKIPYLENVFRMLLLPTFAAIESLDHPVHLKYKLSTARGGGEATGTI